MSMTLVHRLLPAAAAVAALLVAPSLRPAQDPWDEPVEDPPVETPEDGETPEDEVGDELSEELINLLGNRQDAETWSLPEQWQDLLGTWQLMDFDHIEDVIEAENVGGYLHFDEGILTMLIHARNHEPGFLPEYLGQAGIHRWRIVRDDILQTATMMGHSNMGDDFEWEQPNTPREFRLRFVANQLDLERPDGSRLVFGRVRGLAFPDAAIQAIDDARSGLDDDEGDL